jgi:hypothetical protein
MLSAGHEPGIKGRLSRTSRAGQKGDIFRFTEDRLFQETAVGSKGQPKITDAN